MAHKASLSQLQTPSVAYADGGIQPYADIKIHISAEALTRGLSIFEGLKGYWDDDGAEFALRVPELHYRRLCRSARLLEIPIEFDYAHYLGACSELASHLLVPEADLWLRTTLYVIDGHWGEGTRADLIITAFKQTKGRPEPMRLGVSTWRRSEDVSLPYRAKSTANYSVARLARIEGNRRGYDDMVLLNSAGRVAEGTGSAILMVRDGGVVTPPASEGTLESLTIDVIEGICRRDGIAFERRPIDRSELLVADECGLAGTISDLTPVAEIDGFGFEVNGLLAELAKEYESVMRRRAVLEAFPMVTIATSMR